MKSRIQLFLISYILWFLLAWPYGDYYGGWDYQSLIIGVFASLGVSLLFGKDFSESPGKLLQPSRWLYALIFIPVFIYYAFKSSFQVAYMVIHPRLPIHPGIVRIRTSLRNRAAITMLANSITLTPGTLTVQATDEGYLYIHWIEVKTADEEEAGRMIAGKFEYLLSRIFEDKK